MTTRQTLQLLRDHESRNILFVEPDGSWPIVWERAHGVHVWDSAGKKYLDLTAAFGVAAAGHANPNVVPPGKSRWRNCCTQWAMCIRTRAKPNSPAS